MSIIYFILGAFARRWFGGMFPDDKYKILGNRGLQTVFMCLLFLSIFVRDYASLTEWLVGIALTAWLQIQYWSRGHGAPMDEGRSKNPDQKTINRYNERWYHIPCDFLFDKTLRQPQAKYGFWYDFLYMSLRYTCPMFAASLSLYALSKLGLAEQNWGFIKIGLSVSPIYAFCWTSYEQETWLRPQASWLNVPVKWAELIVGGVTYAGVYLIWR